MDTKIQRNVRVSIYLTPREAQEVEDAIRRAEEPPTDWRRNALLAAARQCNHLGSNPQMVTNKGV